MKKILKYTGYSLLTIIALLLIYLGCAWCLSRLGVAAEKGIQPEITVFIKTNGVHTDLVLPVKTDEKDWSQGILYKNTRSRDTGFSYIAFGWGDKGFYLNTPTWADLKASTVLKAAFGLGGSAVHASFYNNLNEGKSCVRLVIAKAQYRRLVRYIENSLLTDSLGTPLLVPTDVRYGSNDAFYEAKGSYNLFHTCNTWANDGLKVAGQKACWWTPFDKGIFYQYRKP